MTDPNGARLGLLLTPREAANMLGVDAATVARYVEDAQLTHTVLRGGERRYVESEIAWLQRSMLRRRPSSPEVFGVSTFQSSEVKQAFDKVYGDVDRLAASARKPERKELAGDVQAALYELVEKVERWAHFKALENERVAS